MSASDHGAASPAPITRLAPFCCCTEEQVGASLGGISRPLGGRGGAPGAGVIFNTGREGYLKPGMAVVLMPGFVLTTNSRAGLQASIDRKPEPWSGLQKARTIAVSLDSAIFESGQFIGPDREKNFAHDTASFTAWRVVDAAVQSDLAAGRSLDDIAVALSLAAKEPNEGSGGRRDWNAVVRAAEAKQLLKLYERSGSQAVRDLLVQHLRQPELLVHR
jgi:hypothetical protein